MSKDSYSPNSKKEARKDSSVRKIVCTGVHSQLMAITIPPDTDIGEEVHADSDQVVFVVEGTAEAILNHQAEAAGERDAIFIPAGTVHKLKNSGRTDLKVFVIYSSPVADTGSQTMHKGRMNFYAIAHSSKVADESVDARSPFPGGIKWISWKSPAVSNVLFATDFSPASDAALPYAISIARHYHSKLHVAHIINPEMRGLMAPQTIERLISQMKEAAVSKIEELLRSGRGDDVQYESIVAEGAVGDALLDMVRKRSIDLVVLGTHGRRGLRKLVLGSVAEEIFRLAPCPVLTVGPRVSGAGAESIQLHHVVYPMELSSDVVKTAGYAISIAKEYSAELTFLNVIEDPLTSADERAWINAASLHWFEDKVAPDLGLGDRAGFVQEFGDPATAILQCAAEKSADLIVMNVLGTHPSVAGQVSGIAHRVVAEASCPVLTVR